MKPLRTVWHGAAVVWGKVTSTVLALPYAWHASRGWFSALTLVLVVQGLTGPVVAVLAGQSVGVITRADALSVPMLMALWLMVFVVDCGLYPLVYLFTSQLNERMTLYMHQVIMNKGLSLKRLDLLDDTEFYDRVSMTLDEAKSRPANYVILYTYILRGVISVVSYAVIMARLSWWLPLLTVASGVPITMALERMRQSNWVAQRTRQQDLRYLEYLSRLPLDRQHAKEIRLFAMGPLITSLFAQRRASYTRELSRLRMSSLVKVIPGLVIGILGYMVSIYGILSSGVTVALSVAGVAAVIQAFVAMRATVDGLVQNMSFLGEKAYFFRDLNQFLNTRENWGDGVHLQRKLTATPQVSESSSGAFDTPYDIELRHVWFAYPGAGNDVLNDVSLHIRPGETLVVCGRNGAGKSTLLNIITGLYRPTKGQVLVNGQILDQDTIDPIRARMSVLFQDYSVYAWDVATNIALNEHVDQERVAQALHFAYGTDRTPPPGLRLVREFGGAELSGGQRQRIGIARAAYKQAGCLLLDEPTSAIDPLREAELFDTISAISRDKTAVIVTHRLALAAISSRIIVIDHGRLAEEGTLEQLRNQPNGLFAHMLAEQARITLA